MKTIKLIIAGLVMTMGFSSCSSLFYDAKVDVLNSIQKGMSRQEVTKILGTPEYRRFDRDIEEWEYSRVLSGKSNISRTQIVVTFEGGRVVAMDSFSGEPRTLPVVPSEVVIDSPAPVYVRGMHPEDFRHFYEKVKSRPFKDVQIVHQGTYEYTEEDGTLTEFKDELTGQTYRSSFEAGSQSLNWVIGAYDFATKAELMGGKPLDTDKGWERGNAGEQRYKCIVAITNDDVAIIFPKANLVGRGASTDGAVGLSMSATPLKSSTTIASEYWFDVEGKSLKD